MTKQTIKMLSIKNINKEIAQYGVKAVKGKGYIYFIDISEAFVAQNISSVFVMKASDLPIEQWVQHVKEEIQNS